MVSSFLLKKGGSVLGLRRNWKRRWFLLEEDAGELHYYADPSLAKQKGTVRLSANSSVRVPEEVAMRGRHRPSAGEATHYFELWDVRDARGRARKTFKVRAESSRDFAEWLGALDACLRRLRGHEVTTSRSSNEAWAAPITPRSRRRGARQESYASSIDDDDYPAVRASMASNPSRPSIRLSAPPVPSTLPLAPHPAMATPPRSGTCDINAILAHSATSKREKIMAINRLAVPSPLKLAGIRAATKGAAALAPRPPPPPPDPALSEKRRALRALIVSTDTCSLEAAVDGAVGAGADYDDDLLVAARTRVDFLVKTDDARAELEKAVAAYSDDAAALGDAAARAVAGGLDPEEPLVAACRRRLGALLARDGDEPPG